MRSSTAGRVIVVVFAVILGATFVLAAVVGSRGHPTRPAAPPSTEAVPPSTSSGSAPPPGESIVTVTGSSPAVSVVIDAGGQETRRSDVALPFSTQVPSTGPQGVKVIAQAGGDPNATIGCSIEEASQQRPSIEAATGPGANVICSAGGQ